MFERDAQYPDGRTVFIADLSSGDREILWNSIESRQANYANLTPSGTFMVFASRTDHLTPDDTSTGEQVFEYDAQTGALVRVSIGQNGYNNNGNTYASEEGNHPFLVARYLPPFTPSEYWSSLTMSVDGSYVFFQSPDGLTPQALNFAVIDAYGGHPVYENNIYEYHDGNVYLISDGRDISAGPGGSSSGVSLNRCRRVGAGCVL